VIKVEMTVGMMGILMVASTGEKMVVVKVALTVV
jgi:hypothetical protein